MRRNTVPPVADAQTARPAAILIAGPTASGKSALALDLARRHDGVIVNTDSMQVYADLRVLTNRPTEAEESDTPHRLYGHVDGAVNHSVGRFVQDVAALMTRLGERLPIFVGGTGLYFKALEDGLSDLPHVPEGIRAQVRAEAADQPTEALHAVLAACDAEGAARLRPSDRMRVMRALEVFRATGQPIASLQGRRLPGPLSGSTLVKVFLAPDREALRARIDARFVAMFGSGALDEVEAIRARRLDSMLPIMRAHGVPGLISYLAGGLTREQAIVRGQGDTRRYAKRQFTWFRHQMGQDWIWASPEEARAVVDGRLSAPAGR